MSPLDNIFHSKLVGALFAIAFASWAWVLQSMSDKVLDGVNDIRSEQVLLKSQIADLRGNLVAIQIKQSEDITTIRERQNGVLKRLDLIESHVDQITR